MVEADGTALAAGRRRLAALVDRVGGPEVRSLLGNREFRRLFAGVRSGRRSRPRR